MTPRERFLSVARGETPDYIPIFGFPGAPGMSWGCMAKTHDRLVATGMPAHVGGRYELGGPRNQESWFRYWGTTGPIALDFSAAAGGQGFKETRRREVDYEVIESENGAVTRQLVDNSITYSMPEFIRYPVRDRESWEFFKERTTPTRRMSDEDIEANCRRFDDRSMPLVIGGGSTYGMLRGLMGTEGASFALMDDPELVHEMMARQTEHVRRDIFPLIERLKPEIVQTGEDLCYNHGMLLSPAQFEEFFAPHYREVCEFAHEHRAIVCIDTDGNAMEFTDVAVGCGVDGIFPYEVKAGNDLFAIREKHPEFILFGWLEKEAINEGNEDQIEPEIMNKVPAILEKRRYFPNGDHGIQPWATFDSLRRFMTLLHEVCSNPEGEFGRG